MRSDSQDTSAGLRAWAGGIYPLEVGVELLIRTSNGRFAGAGQPWVRSGDDPGWWWIDVTEMNEANIGVLSCGEARMLRIAASLLGGAPVDLHTAIPGLDRDHVQFALAAVAHASGSHEHTGGLVPDPNGRRVGRDRIQMSFERLGTLFPWPAGG
ncbi:MAG: hypothetical protein HZY73_07340 [Micropruina sp.]|nr:MAG: hypothetical protein HZY73_07340 [Micropruina sp.]